MYTLASLVQPCSFAEITITFNFFSENYETFGAFLLPFCTSTLSIHKWFFPNSQKKIEAHIVIFLHFPEMKSFFSIQCAHWIFTAQDLCTRLPLNFETNSFDHALSVWLFCNKNGSSSSFYNWLLHFLVGRMVLFAPNLPHFGTCIPGRVYLRIGVHLTFRSFFGGKKCRFNAPNTVIEMLWLLW